VVPLSFLASEYEMVANRLRTLSKRTWSQSSPDWLVYWFLLRKSEVTSKIKTDKHRRLLSYLESGPLPVPEILKKMELMHTAQLDAGELLRQEIIGVGGLTPTDILHCVGRYQPWDVQAAVAAMEVYSRALLREPSEVIEDIWRLMTEIIMVAVVEFLSGKEVKLEPTASEELGQWVFLNSLYQFSPFLKTSFQLSQPLIGIGAPADIFLGEIAKNLHTDFILPGNYQVANAVGAVSGSVVVEREIQIHPLLSDSGLEVQGYYFHASNGRRDFEALEQAMDEARFEAEREALGAADLSGADDPQITLTQETEGLDTYRIKARAVGNPRLSK
jgi:N-methylhydantoinase A/oxoprolinase/acetone carboxylase beta subunit